MKVRCLLAALAAAASVACTPVRSTLPPPYPVAGRTLTAEELEAFARHRCEADSQGAPPPPHPFTTDGCSAWRDAGWVSCCIEHDVAYWCGARARREADEAFRACVRERSSPTNAAFMYAGVRLGGGRFMPFPWRFGYGHQWPHRRIAVQSERAPQTPPTGH